MEKPTILTFHIDSVRGIEMLRRLPRELLLLWLLITLACEERPTIVLGVSHIPANTAELQIMMAYTSEAMSEPFTTVAQERVSVDFRRYRDSPNLLDLFRLGARPPIGTQGRLSIGVAAVSEDGKLLAAGDGSIELPKEGELAVGVDLGSSHSSGGFLLSGSTSSCSSGPLVIFAVEQIASLLDPQSQTRLRFHGFGFLPQARIRFGGSAVLTEWQSFSKLDAVLDLPFAPSGVLSAEFVIEHPDGTQCVVTAKPRTITFYSALSDPQSKPSDAASYHILGLPLRAGYDVKELASGDVDGDGLPDIFLSGSRMQGTGGFLAVLHNRGRLDQGNFFDDPEYYDFGGGSGESVVVGDWNKDGKLDAAVTSKTQSKIVVFYQQSTTIGQRFRQEIAPGGERPDFITKGDLDQDGFVDLITGVANDINGKSVFLIYNLGSSFDMSPPDYFQGAPIFLSDLHYTDISRDGKSDFTLLYSRSIPMGTELKTIGAVQSFVGQPDGSLLGTGENLIQGIGGRAAIGDIDGNGTQDVVSAGPYQPEAQAATNQFSVLLNDGTGKYQKPYTAIDTIPQPYNVALGDFNLDGKLDVVIANVNALDNGRIAIHLNQGSGVLASQNVPDFFTDVGYSTDIEVTDVNLDGKPDLVVLSSGTPGTQKATRLQVLINTTRR